MIASTTYCNTFPWKSKAMILVLNEYGQGQPRGIIHRRIPSALNNVRLTQMCMILWQKRISEFIGGYRYVCTGEGFSTEHVFVIRDTFVTARQKKRTRIKPPTWDVDLHSSQVDVTRSVKPFLRLTATMSSVRYTLKPNLELRLP